MSNSSAILPPSGDQMGVCWKEPAKVSCRKTLGGDSATQ